MTAPADRLLDLMGDEIVRRVLRCLLKDECAQKDVISRVGAAQSSVSRTIALLRAVGLVEADGLRAASLRVRQHDEVLALLMAADRLAEALAAADASAQQDRSREDRRLGIRTTHPRTSAPDAG